MFDRQQQQTKRKKTRRGDKRKGKGVEYGKRKGQSLVGKYGRGKFVVWHCDDAFAATSKCMDGVCGECYVHHMDSGHSCGVCGQKLSSYKNEELERMLKRKRDNWDGIASEKCAICEIVL